MSGAFLQSAVLIVGGSLAAQMMTSYATENIRDLSMRGGDAIYAILAAAVTLAVLPGEYGRPMALGSAATAVRVTASDFGGV